MTFNNYHSMIAAQNPCSRSDVAFCGSGLARLSYILGALLSAPTTGYDLFDLLNSSFRWLQEYAQHSDLLGI